MKFFKSGLLIAVVIVFLASIFISILYFQQSAPGLPRPLTAKQDSPPPSQPLPAEDLNMQTEQKTVQVAFSNGQQQIDSKEVPLYEITKKDNQTIKIVANGDLAKSLVDGLVLPNEKKAQPAQVKKQKNDFERIVRGEEGLTIDKVKTLRALENSIKQNPDAASLAINIVIEQNEGKDGFSSKMKEMGFNTLIATFSTRHPGHIEDDNRNTNLAIAAKKIDGLIIPPGGKFSFNKVVGPRTQQCGFKNAGVISQGKVIPGLGGGICQVSTTMYKAVLMSGMKIDERHNHSIYDGIEYADRGLDAAVSWGSKDFRFTNSLDVPVLIVSRYGKGTVEVEVYAEKKPFESVVLETRNEIKHPFNVQKKNNSSLKKGEVKIVHPGVTGYSIETFRRVTISGKTKEERLSKDRYLTFNRIEEINN